MNHSGGSAADPELHTVAVDQYFRKDAWQRLGLYSREAVQEALEEVKSAGRDARLFRMKTLRKMCACFDIDPQDLLKDPSLLQKIPSGAEQREQLADLLYGQYLGYMTYTDYLRRLIDRLAPAWRSDPPRLAVLKQFFTGSSRKCKEVPIDYVWEWALERCTPEERDRLKQMTDESEQREFLAGKLTEDIFLSQEDELSPTSLLRLMAQTLRKIQEHPQDYYTRSPDQSEQPPGEPVLSEETVRDLWRLSGKENDSPGALLVSCFERCADPSFAARLDRDEQEPVRRLLSEFRSWLGTVWARGGAKKPVTCAERFKYTLRDERRRQVKTILQISSDIAQGVSKPNGKTRRDLYYFAFLFRLQPRRALGDHSPQGDLVDLEKNLFEDYYGDYVFRCLSAAPGDSRYERLPTGEGINYKNFEETIYLYYLLQNTAGRVPPGELFDRAEKTIRQSIAAAKKSKAPEKNGFSETYAFRRELLQKNILRLPEQEFIDYIVRHYAIPTGAGQQAHILADSAQRSAFEALFDHVNYTAEPSARFFRYDPSPQTLPPSECDDPREGRSRFWQQLQKIVQERASRQGYAPDFLRIVQKIADTLCEADFPFRMEYLLPCLSMLRHLLRHSGRAIAEEVLLRHGYEDDRQPSARKKAFLSLTRDAGYAPEEVTGLCARTTRSCTQRELELLHSALLCDTAADIEQKAASIVPKNCPQPEKLKTRLSCAMTIALAHRRKTPKNSPVLSISRRALLRGLRQTDKSLTEEQGEEVFLLLTTHFPGLVLSDKGVSEEAAALAPALLQALRPYPIPEASERIGEVLPLKDLCTMLNAPPETAEETIGYLRQNGYDIRSLPALMLPDLPEMKALPLTKPLREAVLPLSMNRTLPEALCQSVLEQNTFAPSVSRVMTLSALTEKFACDQASAGGTKDFTLLYEAYLQRANELLRETRFQIISPKNMIDTYAILTLYLFLSLPEEE